MGRIYWSFFLLACLGACEKPLLEIQRIEVDRHVLNGFYCFGEVGDSTQGNFQPFSYRASDSMIVNISEHEAIEIFPLVTTMRIYSHSSIGSDGADAAMVLEVGIRTEGDFQRSHQNLAVFSLAFRPERLPDTELPTEAFLDSYFFPGRQFAFGRATDKVEVLLRTADWDMVPARASFLNEPSGSLTITRVEDYEFEYSPPENKFTASGLRGKRITCTFEGSIARYDPEGHQGYIEDFRTDKALPLRNGEAVFFVAYE